MPQSFTTIVGNLGTDPELRFTPSGVAVCRLNVAVANRYFDSTTKEWTERDPSWYSVNCWRNLAENVAETLSKGDRVVVTGDMRQRSWETDDGEKRYTWEMEATDVGVALTFATARIQKIDRRAAAEEKDEVSAKRSTKSRSTSARSKRNDDVPF